MGTKKPKKIGRHKVRLDDIREKWVVLCLPTQSLEDMIKAGHLDNQPEVEWKKLLAMMCGSIGRVRNMRLD